MEQKGKIISVNISEKKGTVKKPVEFISVDYSGIKNDGHYGLKLRQISILSEELINDFSKTSNINISYGDFAENITCRGINIEQAGLLDRFKIGKVILEVTQIGKECHGNTCAIFKAVGSCIMPRYGIFTRVIKSGKIKPGNSISLLKKVFKTAVITLSTRASSGEYKDKSGPRIAELISDFFHKHKMNQELEQIIIPDNKKILRNNINHFLKKDFDLIITTGGTGISPLDITVDTVKKMCTIIIPGIMDNIRIKYSTSNPNSLLSRSIAGAVNRTLIFTLPGSVRASEEYLNEIFIILEHAILMINGLGH